jgi:hypothetical protein
MFGGNSNWRGPVWMPVNAMIIRALLNFYLYYGDNFKIECPTGSGKMMNLFEVSQGDRRSAQPHLPARRAGPAAGLRRHGEVPERSPLARPHPVLRILPRRQRCGAGREPPDRLDRARGQTHPALRKVFACGRDPFFPAWPDVLQLNAFQPRLRQAVIETLADIAEQCDGVRCDMAMLLLNQIFERTWGIRAGQRPTTEYWVDVILAIKKTHPDFLFMAEAYWDLEWGLQQQGFDYCYDKRLYDRLEHDSTENVRLHLCADLAYQEKLVRFIENHDEPRALSVFSAQKERAAAVTIATIPGAKLFHEGQFEGRKVRLPVFLGRRPEEPADPDLLAFYRTLLKAASSEGLREGHWQLCERTGWPDNASCRNLLAWCWRSAGSAT